ncbi:MAG: non-heme iron oxygenase ferredoxin subunit [Candidatus Binataceae bacterium]|nr:non-heme iron oxygenase ferredoxin subunit [Candidatus Binataceae bacterium]
MVALLSCADLAPGSVQRVDVAGFPPLAVYNVDGSYFVSDDTCSHGNASLAEGFLEGDEIECPWHNGKFCVRTGAATAYPAMVAVCTYSVEIADGQVCIAAPSEEAIAKPD